MVLKLETEDVSSTVWKTLPDHRQWTSLNTRICFTGKRGGKKPQVCLKHSPGLVQWLLPAVTTQHPKKQQEPSPRSKLAPKPLNPVLAPHSPHKPTPFWD